MSEILYSDATHTYTDPKLGIIIPSITQLMTYHGYTGPGFWTPESAQRGTDLHSAIESIERGTQEYLQYDDPEIVNRIEAYIMFRGAVKFKAEKIESIEYNDMLHLACRLDLLGLVNGIRTIIEIKSGVKQDWHRLQTAGQAICAGEEYTPRAALYLSKHGMSNYEVHGSHQDIVQVVNLINCYWYDKNHGIKKMEAR